MRPRRADFFENRLDVAAVLGITERLSLEARVHTHDGELVDGVEDFLDFGKRGLWIECDADFEFKLVADVPRYDARGSMHLGVHDRALERGDVFLPRFDDGNGILDHEMELHLHIRLERADSLRIEPTGVRKQRAVEHVDLYESTVVLNQPQIPLGLFFRFDQ